MMYKKNALIARKWILIVTCLFGCLFHPTFFNLLATKNIVLAYVTSGGNELPDPQLVTHINYAFGHIDSTFSKITIDNEQRLLQISNLKQKAPHLKVLLSIGGWESGGFREMAADSQKRHSFANDCQRVVKQFNLDGIDIDWEYPTSNAAGISASPEDTNNYTLLMRDIRKAIGNKQLLTLASVFNGNYIDFKAIDPYIDFVNIMAYDINRPPFHHAALHPSSRTQNGSAEEAIEAHLQKGVPANKLVLGIPFYGHGAKPLPDFINYTQILKLKDYTFCWDSIAKAPYLTDKEGNLACSYENPESIAAKCTYIRQKGLLGIMYWEYNSDDSEGSLRKATYKSMLGKLPAEK